MKEKTITFRISSEEYDRVDKLAASIDRPKSYIFEDAVKNYLDVNEWQVSEIEKAIKAADNPKTKWIAHEEIEKEFLLK